MSLDIDILINNRIKKFKEYIEDERLFRISGGKEGHHCTNADELQNMINNFSRKEWIDYIVRVDSDIYIFDLENETYTIK